MKRFYVARYPAFLRMFFPSLVFRMDTGRKAIYLSFDDGPMPEATSMVLQILAEFDAKATFFCLGKNVEKYPELFKQIEESGHEVGNHTYDHLNGWKTSCKEYFKNIEKADGLIGNTLFRPPYGKITPAQIRLLKKKYRIIMWDVIAGDFDPDTNSDQCVKNVLKNIRPGSIIVFHDTLKAMEKLSKALPVVLKELKEQDYEMLSL